MIVYATETLKPAHKQSLYRVKGYTQCSIAEGDIKQPNSLTHPIMSSIPVTTTGIDLAQPGPDVGIVYVAATTTTLSPDVPPDALVLATKPHAPKAATIIDNCPKQDRPESENMSMAFYRVASNTALSNTNPGFLEMTSATTGSCAEKCVSLTSCVLYSISDAGVCRISSRCDPVVEIEASASVLALTVWAWRGYIWVAFSHYKMQLWPCQFNLFSIMCNNDIYLYCDPQLVSERFLKNISLSNKTEHVPTGVLCIKSPYK